MQPSAPPVTPASAVQLRSIHAAVRLMNADGEAPADPLQRKRRLVADLCRLLGRELAQPADRRLAGDESSGSDVSTTAADEPPAVPLTPRTRQTLERLLAGDSEKQIAARLGLSRHTVHVYIKTLYKRFAVNSRGELFARFIRQPIPSRVHRLQGA